jgi:hypothetical protein
MIPTPGNLANHNDSTRDDLGVNYQSILYALHFTIRTQKSTPLRDVRPALKERTNMQ